MGGRGAPRFEEAPESQRGMTGAFAKPKRPGHPFMTRYFRVAVLAGNHRLGRFAIWWLAYLQLVHRDFGRWRVRCQAA